MVLLTDNWKFDALALFLAVATSIYFYAKHTYSYWERRGFDYLPDANYVFGHFKPTFTQKESLGDFITRIYNSTQAPFIGIYSMFRPILFVRDPELIRTILIKGKYIKIYYRTIREVPTSSIPIKGNILILYT